MKSRNKNTLVVIICLTAMLYLLAISYTFERQKHQLQNEFDRLASSNLTSFAQSLCNNFTTLVLDVQNTLSTLSSFAELRQGSEEEFLPLISEVLNDSITNYSIDYINKETLLEGATSNRDERDQAICISLLQGKNIVTDIRYSQRMEGYFFAIASPLIHQDEILGALRVRINIQDFAEKQTLTNLYTKLDVVIINENQQILYQSNKESTDELPLLESMEIYGFEADSIEQFKQALAFNQGECAKYRTNQGIDYFITFEPLNTNGWTLLTFLNSNDYLFQSDIILQQTINGGITVILLTTIILVVIFLLLLQQRRQLNLEVRRYAALAQFTDTLLFEYDVHMDTLTLTSNVSEQLALNTHKLTAVLRNPNALDWIAQQDQENFKKVLSARYFNDQSVHLLEVQLKDKNGVYRWYSCQYRYVYELFNHPRMVVGKLVDITTQRGKEQFLLEQAQRDPMTGLYNRAAEDLIDALLHQQANGFLLMLDLDNFKEINDHYGHSVGDLLLIHIATILQQTFRSEDIIARVGGDEFVIYLAGQIKREIIELKVQNIFNLLHELVIENQAISATVSIGIAEAPVHGCSYSQLYQAADQAMYQIKQKEKDGYAFYE